MLKQKKDQKKSVGFSNDTKTTDYHHVLRSISRSAKTSISKLQQQLQNTKKFLKYQHINQRNLDRQQIQGGPAFVRLHRRHRHAKLRQSLFKSNSIVDKKLGQILQSLPLKFRKKHMARKKIVSNGVRKKKAQTRKRVASKKKMVNSVANQLLNAEGTQQMLRSTLVNAQIDSQIRDRVSANPKRNLVVNHLPPPAVALTDNPQTVLPDMAPSAEQIMMYSNNYAPLINPYR